MENEYASRDERKELVNVVLKCCREWRIKNNITQKHIADELHIHKNNVSNFECGHSTPLYIYLWYATNGFELLECEEVWQALKNY